MGYRLMPATRARHKTQSTAPCESSSRGILIFQPRASSIIEIIVQTIRVETPSAKYDVFAGSGLLETLAPRIERVVGAAAAAGVCGHVAGDLGAVDEEFLRSFRTEPPVTLFLASPAKQHKTMKSVERLLREMVRAGGDRGSLLIAFGGGIVGDVGGFVAAMFHARNSLMCRCRRLFWRRWTRAWAAKWA